MTAHHCRRIETSPAGPVSTPIAPEVADFRRNSGFVGWKGVLRFGNIGGHFVGVVPLAKLQRRCL
jgi:hypothetical protein